MKTFSLVTALVAKKDSSGQYDLLFVDDNGVYYRVEIFQRVEEGKEPVILKPGDFRTIMDKIVADKTDRKPEPGTFWRCEYCYNYDPVPKGSLFSYPGFNGVVGKELAYDPNNPKDSDRHYLNFIKCIDDVVGLKEIE